MKDISIDFIKEKDVDQLIPPCALHSKYERVPFEYLYIYTDVF